MVAICRLSVGFVGVGFCVRAVLNSVFDFAVAGGERGFPAHSSCAQHQCGWEAEDHVCPHFYQGHWPPSCQYRLQEGRRRHEQEVTIFLFIYLFKLKHCFVVSVTVTG